MSSLHRLRAAEVSGPQRPACVMLVNLTAGKEVVIESTPSLSRAVTIWRNGHFSKHGKNQGCQTGGENKIYLLALFSMWDTEKSLGQEK